MNMNTNCYYLAGAHEILPTNIIFVIAVLFVLF